MKITELGGGRARVFYTTAEYATLLDCAPNAKFRNALRLSAHSLRRKTTVELTYDQFKKVSTSSGDLWVVGVEAKDTTDRDQSGKHREVWVCDDLVQSIKQNAGRHWGEDYPFWPESKSTLQNRMVETRKAAKKRTGNDQYLKVSFHDGRRYFANHLLYRHEIDSEIVQQLGGWASKQSMREYLRLPDDILAHNLDESGILNTQGDLNAGKVANKSVDPAIKKIDQLLKDSTRDEKKEIVTKLQSLMDRIDEVNMSVSDLTSSKNSNQDDGGFQSALEEISSGDTDTTQSYTVIGGLLSALRHYSILTGLRAKKEREWMRDDPGLVDPGTLNGAVSLLCASLVGGIMISSMLAAGNSLPVVVALTIFAGVISMIELQADVESSTHRHGV